MRAFLIILLSLILVSCDKGLSPDLADENTGFGGTVTFIGEWDPSLTQTHVVVFKNPLLSISDFNVFNLSFVSEVIPNGSSSYRYSTFSENSLVSTVEAGKYSYIAVAQSLRDTITLNREDWIVAGIYYTDATAANPGILNLPEGAFIENVDIVCDFNNPPPQPPSEQLSKALKKIFAKVISGSH